MKKHFLSILAVVLAVALSAFSTDNKKSSKEIALKFIRENFNRTASASTWFVFEYTGGAQFDPLNYVKISGSTISQYCPGSSTLCAIMAEEDIFNPGHPTIESIQFLLSYFGFYYYFPREIPGLIEFRIAN